MVSKHNSVAQKYVSSSGYQTVRRFPSLLIDSVDELLLYKDI